MTIGQEIVCVNNTGAETEIKLNQVYVIESFYLCCRVNLKLVGVPLMPGKTGTTCVRCNARIVKGERAFQQERFRPLSEINISEATVVLEQASAR